VQVTLWPWGCVTAVRWDTTIALVGDDEYIDMFADVDELFLDEENRNVVLTP
jgi:hypothetical protein